MKKIEDLEGINKELRADYVPIAVVNNFNRSIKDIEVSWFNYHLCFKMFKKTLLIIQDGN